MFLKDEWLSKQISKNTYLFKVNELGKNMIFQEWNKFIFDHKNESFFIFSKINTGYVEKWQCLEKEGFKLIDTNIKYELTNRISSETNSYENTRICFAEKEYQKSVEKIARDNFIYSRFHLDPLIDNEIASKIKQNWVKNYFSGKRGNQLVVALLNDEPVGFLLLILKNRELFIDLIGVDKKAQGKGLASAMINYAEKNIIHKCIKVGTQIGNFPSIKLYQKLGFILTGSDYVFHYHSK